MKHTYMHTYTYILHTYISYICSMFVCVYKTQTDVRGGGYSQLKLLTRGGLEPLSSKVLEEEKKEKGSTDLVSSAATR